MPELSVASKAEFLASLERLMSEAAALPHDDMLRGIESVSAEEFTATE